MINTVYAPSTITTAETFIWYRVNGDLRLGLAHLWKQNAFRFLASVRLHKETDSLPGVFASAGVQGIGTGNPGYSVTFEKNFRVGNGDTFNLFTGVGFRSNENHSHIIGGVKYAFSNGLTFGVQHDGHQTHPFATYSFDEWFVGYYLVDAKSPAYMVGIKF